MCPTRPLDVNQAFSCETMTKLCKLQKPCITKVTGKVGCDMTIRNQPYRDKNKTRCHVTRSLLKQCSGFFVEAHTYLVQCMCVQHASKCNDFTDSWGINFVFLVFCLSCVYLYKLSTIYMHHHHHMYNSTPGAHLQDSGRQLRADTPLYTK